MAGSDALFAGSVPEVYERLLVPLIFESYAEDLGNRLRPIEPKDILEIAAGTGVVTRAVARAVPHARIVATDLSQPMLDRAAVRQPADDRIAWRQADAQALPFGDGTFDVVVCQFGAMFFPDRTKAYREALRVLRPGGRLLFNVWDRLSENDFALVVTDALADVFPDSPPDFLARVPYGYYNVQNILEQLAEAGFTRIDFETVDKKSRAFTASDPAIAFCQGTPLRSDIEARDASRLDEATQAAAEAIGRRFGAGPVEGRIRAHVLTAAR